MNNPLTPNKIQKLMYLAEDRSFQCPTRFVRTEENLSFPLPSLTPSNETETNTEESSGVLDLDRVEGFGESEMSLGKSSVFNPGEISGRSTGTEERALESPRVFEEYGRHSVALDSITSHMDKQTSEINDLMRHSIANYSFHSKGNLTADEASLVMREAPLPIQNSTYNNTQTNFHESATMSNSDMSVGAYFQTRSEDFRRILTNASSPGGRSVADTSNSMNLENTQNNLQNTYQMDQLDCVPVRQPKNNEKIQETSPNARHNYAIPKNPVAEYTGVSNINKESQGPSDSVQTNPVALKKQFMSSTKPTEVLLRNLHTTLCQQKEDTEHSIENSMNLSTISDILRKQSNVSITDILKMCCQKKQTNRKQPLNEINVNTLENKKQNEDDFVKKLIDTRNSETASSSGTVKTVLNMEKLNINKDVPTVIITNDGQDNRKERRDKTRSSPSKSCSTRSTIHENKISITSDDISINNINTRGNASTIPSPNLDYKELDQSVVWHEVLQQRQLRKDGLAKDQWAEITTLPVEGYVGVSNSVTITVTTLTDSWLTARFKFDDLPNDGKDLIIELPRLPLLLSPGKSEKFTLQITSNVEMNDTLPFKLYMTDGSIDHDSHIRGYIDVNIKMPTIQAISSDGVNVLTYPPIKEKLSLTKYFILISDCPVDLQLELLVAEGDSMFTMNSVQEIRNTDVNKVLMEHQEPTVVSKTKGKGLNKQLCRLSTGNAIKVMITFNAPTLADLDISDKIVTFKGTLHVNMIGIQNVMKRVSLMANVGISTPVIMVPGNKIELTHEPTTINVSNTGTIAGKWNLIIKSKYECNFQQPFKVSTMYLEIRPGATKEMWLKYTGPPDVYNEGILILEDTCNGSKTTIEISGGSNQVQPFPIKTSLVNMCWVRAGRKELSLKNTMNKKIQLRCQIIGDGFSVDLPGVETRGTFILKFGPLETKSVSVLFTPDTCLPCAAMLHFVFDKNYCYAKKVKLFGCAQEVHLRWSRLVTYGDTVALVRAVEGAPVAFTLYNRARAHAFLAADVQYNLQYRWVSDFATLTGARQVVSGGARPSLSLQLPWARLTVRRAAATALATLTLLTGPEITRRRILRIIRDETTGTLDTSLLPDRLKILAERFDNEDDTMDEMLANFSETKASLNELFSSMQELTAQIDLPPELTDHTILIVDDTVLEHHTLCD